MRQVLVRYLRRLPIAALILTPVLWRAHAQPATLHSVMSSYSKAPDCSDDRSIPRWMGVSLTVVMPNAGTGYEIGRGEAIDRCLAQKTSFKRNRRPTGPTHYEFEASGHLDFDGGPDATFTLTLGESLVRLRGSGPSVGRLVITSADGREKILSLADDIHVSSNGRLIQGTLESGNTAVLIVIRTCTLESCSP